MKITEKMNENKLEESIHDVLKPYLKKWFWILTFVLASVVLTYIYLKYSVFVYKINSTVLIKDAKKTGGMGGEMSMLGDLAGLSSMGTNSIENEIEIFKSQKLMHDVVDELGLQIVSFVETKYGKREVYGKNNPFKIYLVDQKEEQEFKKNSFIISDNGPDANLSDPQKMSTKKIAYGKLLNLGFAKIIISKNPHYKPILSRIKETQFIINTRQRSVLEYQQKVIVALVNKDATVIDLTMNYPEIQKAKDILNRLVVVYNKDAINDKKYEAQKTASFIDDRIKIIAKELGEVETEKEQFKISNQIADLETEAKLSLETVASSSQKILEIETQKQINNSLLSYLNAQSTFDLLPTNLGLESTEANNNILNYNQLILKRNALLENATPKNPVVKEVSDQIDELKSSIKQSLLKNRSALDISSRITEVEKGNVSHRISKLPKQEKMFRSIARQQEIKETLYLLLLEKREQNAISLAITAPKAKIVDYAYSSNAPVSPNKLIFYIASLVFGVLIPVAFIYLKNLLNNKLSNKNELSRMLRSSSVLAEIPKLLKGEEELVKFNDITPLSEAFRILATNVNFMLPESKLGKVIIVTSTVKGEGKTFVAANLSLILANIKNRGIIIGSDIRNPQLQRFNPASKKYIGLTEFLHDTSVDLKDIIKPSDKNPFMDIIFSGIIPPNPTELLSNGRFEELINLLKQKYEYIVVDTAPLMLVTDTFLISKFATATVYVTRSEYTEKQLIEFANIQVDNKKIINAGFVINGVKSSNLGYGNKYGYGYGQTKKTIVQKLVDLFRNFNS